SESLTSEVDKSGRICIPKRLRDYAQIEGEVMVVGLYERLELWSPVLWTQYLSRIEEVHETELNKILNIL
ncbi:MAG: division/cell wall cluster transcriptional repressor MraZ, partial [Nitrospinota bacterium]